MRQKANARGMDRDANEYAVQGNNALKHAPLAYDENELADIRAHYGQKATRVRREEEKARVGLASNPVKVAAALLAILMIAGSYGFIIMREGTIAQNQRAIHEVKAELDELLRQNSVLEVRVETVDTQWIEEQAKGRLGMILEPETYIKVHLQPAGSD